VLVTWPNGLDEHVAEFPSVNRLGSRRRSARQALDAIESRIAHGRWANAGQTCTAPDYVLVVKDVAGPLLEQLQETVMQFYGEEPQTQVGPEPCLNG
jgi:Aldehyde dehydrogenase family